MSTVNEKMTTLATAVRELSGTTDLLGLDDMTTNVSDANDEVSTQADLISQIKSVVDNLPEIDNESTISKPEQEKTVEITENGTVEITPDEGYVISKVTAIVNVSGNGNIEPNPSDIYQRVEYITSAEEETYPYIITDFTADNTCGLEIIAAFPVMQDRIPMGSRIDTGATRFYCVYPLSTSSCYFGFNNGSSVSCSLSLNTKYRLQTNFMNSRLVNIFDMDGIRKGGINISATLTQHTCPVAIFGYNYAYNGTVTSKREFKLYSARCSRGHEIVREYIPCYRKSDGEIGLYEKFTNTFLPNVGTGAFAKGADVEW